MTLLRYLRSLETADPPRVHANGFLQIDITPAVRLHIWGDDRIPRQKVPTPIHDHAFSFTSRVLVGALSQRTYRIMPAYGASTLPPVYQPHQARTREPGLPVYQPHQARVRHGEDTTLSPVGQAVVARLAAVELITPGNDEDACYEMQAGEFHETVPLEPSVSVIVKSGKTLSQGGASPTVLVPVGVEPSNEFDRHRAASFGEMWTIVGDVIGTSGEQVTVGLLRAVLVQPTHWDAVRDFMQGLGTRPVA